LFGPYWENIDLVLFFHHLEELGTPVQQKRKGVFQDASRNLREWVSNSQEFLKTIPEQDRVEETKVVGTPWDTVRKIIKDGAS